VTDDKQTDLMTKLTGLSEEAVRRLQDAPGGDRVLGAVNGMRERLDDLQKKVRGIDELEKRLTTLEKKVDKLAKAGSSTAHQAEKNKS
jgi:hypothetical protein